MPYITKFKFNNILREFDFEFDSDLYDELSIEYSFLSKKDIIHLAKYQAFLENSDDINFRYVKLKFQNDDVVFKSSPAFHSNKECEYLNADFENLRIPSKIKKRGSAAKMNFFKWAGENKSLYVRDKEAFKFKACNKFKLNYPEDIEDIFYENTGYIKMNDFTLSSIKKEIQKIKRNANAFYFQSQDHKTILSRYKQRKFYYKSEYDIKESDFNHYFIKSILKKQCKEFDEPIIELHKELLRIMFNPDLSFNKNLLLKLGFKKCKKCHSDYESKNHKINNKEPTKNIFKNKRKTSSEITLEYYKMALSPEEILSIRKKESKPITSLRTIEDHILNEIDNLSDSEISMCYSKSEKDYMLKTLRKKKKIIGLRGAMELLVEKDISYFVLRMFLHLHPEIKIIPFNNYLDV